MCVCVCVWHRHGIPWFCDTSESEIRRKRPSVVPMNYETKPQCLGDGQVLFLFCGMLPNLLSLSWPGCVNYFWILVLIFSQVL